MVARWWTHGRMLYTVCSTALYSTNLNIGLSLTLTLSLYTTIQMLHLSLGQWLILYEVIMQLCTVNSLLYTTIGRLGR